MKRSILFHIMSRQIAILLIALLAFASVSYWYNLREMEKYILRQGESSAQRNIALIESAFDEVYQFSSWFSTDADVRAFLQKNDYSSNTERVVSIAHLMENTLSNLLLTRFISNYCLVDKEGNAYWSISSYDSFFIDWFIEHALDNEPLIQHSGFTKAYKIPDNYVYPVQHTMLSFISSIHQITQGQTENIGHVIVNLDMDLLQSDIIASFSQVGMIDEDGNLMYLSGGGTDEFLAAISPLTDNVSRVGSNYYFINTIGNSRWQLICVLDSRTVAYFPDITGWLTVIFGVLSVLMVFLFVQPKLMQISRQIIKLDQAMARYASGHADTQVRLKGTRELVGISDNFNSMVTQTNQYLSDMLESQHEQQRTSFELLLAKINPHFIYNTLNSVIYLARQKKHREIIELTSAFVSLLHDSIHKDEYGDFAPVSTEVEIVEKYIVIQTFRYTNRFTFTASYDPELSMALIPRNLLQPLVENAILHGICPCDYHGTIELSIRTQGHYLVIRVLDNGVGIDEALIEKLLSPQTENDPLTVPSRMRSIGVQNVAGKLRFLYPNSHRFKILNQENCGAEMYIAIALSDIRFADQQPPYRQDH